MKAKDGIRLFARNIRGYLGNTEINEAMAKTASDEPDNFWYYNNGVTIVCDDVKHKQYEGKDVIRVARSHAPHILPSIPASAGRVPTHCNPVGELAITVIPG